MGIGFLSPVQVFYGCILICLSFLVLSGTLLPGYTVEGLEQAKTEHAAAEVSEGGIFTPENREKPSVLGKLSVAKTQEKTPTAPGTSMKKKEDIQL